MRTFEKGADAWDRQVSDVRRHLIAKGEWSETREARYRHIYAREANQFDEAA